MNKRKGNQIGVFGMEIGFFDSLVIDQHFGDSTIDVTIKKSVFQKISVSKNFGFISTAAKLNIFLVLNFGSSLLIQFILNVPKSQSQYWMKMTTSPMYLSHLPSLICQFQILVCTFYIKCPRASLWFNDSGNRFFAIDLPKYQTSRINIFLGWVEENGSIGMHIAYVRAEDMDSAGIKVCY